MSSILDRAKRYGPSVKCDEYGNHPGEQQDGIYVRIDDPVLAALVEYYEASHAWWTEVARTSELRNSKVARLDAARAVIKKLEDGQ